MMLKVCRHQSQQLTDNINMKLQQSNPEQVVAKTHFGPKIFSAFQSYVSLCYHLRTASVESRESHNRTANTALLVSWQQRSK